MNHTPTQSTEAEYSDQLTLLQENTELQKMVEKVGMERSWWSANCRWKRTYARFNPRTVPYATILLETTESPQEICQIEASFDRLSDNGKSRVSISDTKFGFLRVTKFPYDPWMPALPEILSRHGRATVVRYRPGKRCTIRFDYPDRKHSEYAKVFTDESGASIYKDSIELWTAFENGQLDFAVARPIRWEPETRTLWQGEVDGTPVKTRLFNRYNGCELAEKMGVALASLPQSRLQPETTFDSRDQMKRSRRYASELCDRLPDLADLTTRLVDNLAVIHDAFGNHQKVAIHGAPHVHQWLYSQSRLGLVDFDRFCSGDPELDVATFISEIDFENPKEVPIQEINQAFRDGYESIFGPLNPTLLNAYRAHKRLAKALKAARAVRPDYQRRPKRNVIRALECLE